MKHRHTYITCTVERCAGRFIARTLSAEAIDDSAGLAVRALGARHYRVHEEEIEVEPMGERIMRAWLLRPAPARNWPLFWASLFFFGWAIACYLMFTKGGAS